MPKSLPARTKAQREADVAYLAALSLKELRTRQDLVGQQKQQAYQKYMVAHLQKDAAGVEHWVAVGNNLDAMDADLIDAISRREFRGAAKRRKSAGPKKKAPGRRR